MMFAGRWNCITWMNDMGISMFIRLERVGDCHAATWRDGHKKAQEMVFLNSFPAKVSIDKQVAQVMTVMLVVCFPTNFSGIWSCNSTSHPTRNLTTMSCCIIFVLISKTCFFSLNDREQRPPTAPKLAPIPVALGTLRPSKPAKVAGRTEQKTWMIDTESLFFFEVVW